MSNTTARLERRCRFCGQVAPADVTFCSHCGASLSHQAPTNDPLLARLRTLFERELEIERELGRGGTAAVYLAYDAALQRRVAVKTLLPDVAADPGMVARFIREARTVASLQHPHVVSVYGVRNDDEISAIVMQYVDGRSLDVVLRETSPLSLATAGRVLAQVAAGLQHAHERGIVHRDVKPANVLMDRDGRAFVSDFGLAQPKDSTRITDTGLVVGTLAYMSPEQRTGGEVHAAADQYAFGVMAFEVLTGRLPFTGSLPEMVNAHLFAAPPSVRARRGDVPQSVDAVIMRMLAKDPAARFPHLREVEREFRALIPHDSGTTSVVAKGGIAVTGPGEAGAQRSRVMTSPELAAVATAPRPLRVEEVVPPPTRVERAQRPLRAYAIAAAAIVVIAGGAVGLALVNRRAESGPRDSEDRTRIEAPGAMVAAPNQGDNAREPGSGGAASRAGERDASARGTTRPADTAAPPQVTTASSPDSGVNRGADSARGAGGALSGSGLPVVVPRESNVPPPPGAGGGVPPVTSAGSPARLAPPATLPDARALARQFVTLLNGGQWRDVDRLAMVAGDTTLRAELIRLVRSAPEFRAGFQRVASQPEDIGEQFATECVLDLEWRGGRMQVIAELRASYGNGAWHLAGLRLSRAN